MGNSCSLGGFHLLRNGGFSNRTQLGKSITIDLKNRKEREYGSLNKSEKWEVEYTVEGYTACTLTLTKTMGYKSGCGDYEKLEIGIQNLGCVCRRRALSNNEIYTIEGAEAGLLSIKKKLWSEVKEVERDSKIMDDVQGLDSLEYDDYKREKGNAWGGITETSLTMYGLYGKRMSLFVQEWKKKGRNEKPFSGTLAHYYVNKMASDGVDIGLSVVIKIGVSDYGHLNFDVDGPVQHPTTALLYMFEQVQKTRIWKPTLCAHCANIRRQPCPMFLQSESEDSDGNRLGTRQIARRVANRGAYNGIANGSFIEGNNHRFYF